MLGGALAAFTLVGCGGGITATSASAPLPANAPALEQTYINVVATVLPSVVQITTDRALGSGVVFDAGGHIVTNAHVVGEARKFQVRLADTPQTLSATLVDSYPPNDLAVIKLDQPPASLHPARFANSATVRVGEIVLAMGNPLGLTGSVTDGIISFNGRTVTEFSETGAPGATLPELIQTSAPINPGNSGGALVNLNGEVVGIPTLGAITPTMDGRGGSAAAGLGFAIPSNLVSDIAGQMVKNGRVINSHRAALGVQVVTVVGPDGQPAGMGVVNVVSDGPAATAGVRPGDVITAVNNIPVHRAAELAQVLAKLDPGQAVQVTVINREGTSRTVTVTLGQLPGS
jgi:putative serine protease PepD